MGGGGYDWLYISARRIGKLTAREDRTDNRTDNRTEDRTGRDRNTRPDRTVRRMAGYTGYTYDTDTIPNGLERQK